MSKNKPEQREVHTRPVSRPISSIAINGEDGLKTLTHTPTQAEGPTYIITHQSHPTLRAITITYRGDIEQWIDSNPDKYIVHLVKL